ncbi:ssDNA-binding protein [Glutamicibacter sp. X7]
MSTNNPTRVVTGEVRLSYANIFEAKSIQGGKPKCSVSLIISKGGTETLAKIERAIEAGTGKFGGKRPNKAPSSSRRVTGTSNATTKPTQTRCSSTRTRHPRPTRRVPSPRD